MTAALEHVTVAVDDLGRATEVYRAIVGTEPDQRNGTTRFPAGRTSIVLDQRGRAGPEGVVGADFVVDDLGARRAELSARSIPTGSDASCIELCLNGLTVRLLPGLHGVERRSAPSGATQASPGAARGEVDHLALRVADLDHASDVWAAAIGCEAHPMGLHPVSGGAFSASRLHLGAQMVELVSPTPGIDSPIAQRLASHGEGPAALAVPSPDVDETLRRLRSLDVRVFRHDPHWMVHPADAGGVLVQLTARVNH